MSKEVDPVAALRAFVSRYPTQREAAAALDIHEAYLSDLLRGRRDASQRILERLGLRRAVVQAKNGN